MLLKRPVALTIMMVVSACTDPTSEDEELPVAAVRVASLGVFCSTELNALDDDEDPDTDPPPPSQIYPATNPTQLGTALANAVAGGGGVIVLANGTYNPITLPVRPPEDTGWIVIVGCAASEFYAPSACPGMPNPPVPTLTGRIADADVVPVFETSGSTPAIRNEVDDMDAA